MVAGTRVGHHSPVGRGPRRFTVVANFWWHHHGLFRLLDAVEPGLVAVNLALLGAVAVVPFPTELVGADPTSPAAALAYLALMLAISVLHLLLVHRAATARLWRDDVPAEVPRRLQAGWAGMIGVTAVALLVAVWIPVAGLALLLLTGPADRLAAAAVRPSAGGPTALPARRA